MSDTQMKRLLEGIKENETKTQALSQSLMQFNESFKSLVDQLSNVEPMASLQESGQKVKGLNESLDTISKEIRESKTFQEKQFKELFSQIKNQSSKNTSEENQSSETAVYHKGKIYMISQDRVCVSKYDTFTDSYEMVYGEDCEIKEIILYHDEVVVFHTDGKLCTLEGKHLGVQGIQKAIASLWGLLLLNDKKELCLYKNSKYIITVAEEVEHFELLSARYLFYQTATRQNADLMVYKDYLKDLMTSPVEENSSQRLFAYGVDSVHDKVYTIDADDAMKEQVE